MTDDNELYDFSRRKLLAGMGTIGLASAGAGLGTSALLWDEETFGSAEDPNVLQAGTLDLEVDWEGHYFDDDGTEDSIGSGGLTSDPPAIIDLQDVKPGDVLEVTLSAHPMGNPAFLGMFFEEIADTEGGESTEPEATAEAEAADGVLDEDGGELDDYMNVVLWYDDGDNIPDEVTDLDADGDDELTAEEVDSIAAAGTAEELIGGTDDDFDAVFYAGTLSDLDGADFTLDATAAGNASEEFGGRCFPADATQYVGALAWVPRDIPDVNDNIIQGDRLTFSFGFDAIQCRHNVDEGGDPIDGNISAADNESTSGSGGT